MNFSPLNIILIGIAGLLGVGFYGLLITRNLIKVVMMLQILIKAVVLALVFAGKVSGNLGAGTIHSRDSHCGRHDRGSGWLGVGGASAPPLWHIGCAANFHVERLIWLAT